MPGMANPFLNRPQDLNEHTWYLVRADQIQGDSDVGSWRQAGEPRRMLFPGSAMVCWEIIRVFHDRDNSETDWMMLQYEMTTQNVGTVSLCRIGKGPMNHDDDAQVSGVLYTFQAAAAENLPESELFLGGDYMELLDLDVPLSPRSN